MRHTPAAPGDIVDQAESRSRGQGHDHAGPLSWTASFTPAAPPLQRFPASHAHWDEMAAELPALYASLEVRRRLETLPVLDAGPDALADAFLQRAATVLGIVVHAYHRVEPRHETPTPASVLTPWHQVCARLGRERPFLSYLDLVVANWRPRDPDTPTARPLLVEAVRLLVPTVGTDEEQIFYLTQLEMLSRGTPLLTAAADAVTATDRDDPHTLTDRLLGMTACVREITAYGLRKIEPRPGRRFHVDPVVWAKTVAPLAVPLVRHGLGPSGTASPMFHLLDTVIGRTGYRSFIGEEARRLRASHPPNWRAFLESTAAADISGYATAHPHPPLRAALTGLRAAYAGEDGLLARHRLKVAGYLNTSYRIGRDVTISGFPAAARVAGELATSRTERPAPEPPAPTTPHAPAPPGERAVGFPEVLRHDHTGDRHWIVVEDGVYDVTDFLARHPGGVAPLHSYLGTDATAIFEELGHHRDRVVTARLRRLRVGRLEHPPGTGTGTYATWLRWATDLTRRGNAFLTDLSIRESRTSLASGTGDLTPYTLQFAIEAHERFHDRTYGDITGALHHDLTGSPAAPPTTDPLSPHLYAALPGAGPQTLQHLEKIWREAITLDQLLLHTVRSALIAGLTHLHRHPAHLAPLLPHLAHVTTAATTYHHTLAALTHEAA
ncbi:cytochrome b5 domain-containing protein [Streptomyces xiamenensis]|uniref:cytochrome b5 domain-containing protein n=1 Tax=Streptomyces xiamenensis TaxID=408015 RepID=UPI0035D6655D